MLDRRIKEKIAECGERHYSLGIQKDKLLLTEMKEATKAFPNLSIPEMVAVIIHNQTPVCQYGSRKKYRGLTMGFAYCGRAAQCQCAREAVSESCKRTMAMRSTEDQTRINAKRDQTVQSRYGSNNVSRVEKIKAKREATLLARYGVRSALELTDLKEAGMVEKYGVKNPSMLASVIEQRGETYYARTGFRHPMHDPDIVASILAQRAEDFGIRVSAGVLDFGYEKLISLLPEGIVCLFERDEYTGRHINKRWVPYKFQCMNCGTQFVRVLVRPTKLGCPKCKSYTSEEENNVADFVQHLGFSVERTNRTMIAPLELDIIIHEAKLAIEYGGLRFHCEISGERHPRYHIYKLNQCNQKGYRLITIFGDEWLFNREIVESRIRSILGLSKAGVGARKLSITKISWEQSKEFLDKNHIQGAGFPGFVRYGAFDGNILCAIMSFGHSRFRRGDYIEMLRFCTDGRNHPGIASRLFQQFVSDYSPRAVISYADRRWSEGHLYRTLGFNFIGNSEPGYSYVYPDNEVREHRLNYTKEIIVEKMAGDPQLTEWENMKIFGYDRIWDCGEATFMWKKP